MTDIISRRSQQYTIGFSVALGAGDIKVIIRIFWKFILIKNKFLSNY